MRTAHSYASTRLQTNTMIHTLTIPLLLLSDSSVTGFAVVDIARSTKSIHSHSRVISDIAVSSTVGSRLTARIFANNILSSHNDIPTDIFFPPPSVATPPIVPVLAAASTTAVFPFPALAATATSVLPSALWAYGHFLSILVIVGCLTAERIIVKADMTPSNEDTIVKLDLVYGLMAALLIISGFARASTYGQGGDYYIHEILFWVKMTVSGVWGGLSLFPSRESMQSCSFVYLLHV